MADYCYQSQASSTGSSWLPEYAYSPSNNMQMQDWARAFPRPRHSRVMKPRSAGNSPSSMARRRTTVAQSGMQGVPNQYQSSLEAALLASAVRNPRPISWHPSSARTRGLSHSTYFPDYTQENYADMSTIPNQSLDMNALSVYGSENMLSYPMSADATLSPDSYIPFYLDTNDAMPLQHTMPNSQVESMAWDTGSNPVDMSTMQTTSDGWSLDMLSMANIPPPETTCPSYASVPSPGELSGPSTPDFLPIQQFDSPASIQEKKQGKPEEELVGMGLYSQPNGSMSQSQQGILGKGLKLEETFSPSDDEKDEDDDENDMEPVPQQSMSQQPAPMPQHVSQPRQYAQPALNLLHKSFFFDHDDMDQQTMPSAPFASLNQSCMSYGYGWI
ncbi:uncharacterized protein N7503_005298 [Penicillium pulvis]|uniref:uncharacterized protein n=1 Tax=Penicillium pulvis TaxID=1562058 RepID=UPI00254708CC|nr:uncharacterized protein N7503_005298 [Penicillium pulvis]KAJ5802848.1 hypothetical protein N7503_005298 [Penicillium pulvis]